MVGEVGGDFGRGGGERKKVLGGLEEVGGVDDAEWRPGRVCDK